MRISNGRMLTIVGIVTLVLLTTLLAGRRQERDETAPLEDRIRVQYHEDENGRVVGYDLIMDGEILLTLWDDDTDGLLDMFEYFSDGTSGVLAKDRNGDRRLDWWELRTGPETGRLARDDDYDGVVDHVSELRIVTKH